LFDADLVCDFVKLIARLQLLGILQALWSWVAKAANSIEWQNEAATEILYFGERVGFAALVQGLERIADLNDRLSRGHVPRANGMMGAQLTEEFLKTNASLTGTRARPCSVRWLEIERIRIASIKQSDGLSVLGHSGKLRRRCRRNRVAVIANRRAGW